MTNTAAKSRRIELSFLIGTFVTNHLVRVQKAFDGDLAAALVMATIANRNMQRYYTDVAGRSEEGLDKLIESGSHMAHLRHCNAYSVSSATGIPRETVRRKVKWLAAKGWITVGERGELTITAGISETFAEFDRETIEGFLATARKSLAIADRAAAPER
jgi:hypothetical protein